MNQVNSFYKNYINSVLLSQKLYDYKFYNFDERVFMKILKSDREFYKHILKSNDELVYRIYMKFIPRKSKITIYREYRKEAINNWLNTDKITGKSFYFYCDFMIELIILFNVYLKFALTQDKESYSFKRFLFLMENYVEKENEKIFLHTNIKDLVAELNFDKVDLFVNLSQV